jgi:hypothetical protein
MNEALTKACLLISAVAFLAGCDDRSLPGLLNDAGFSSLVFVKRPHARNSGDLIASHGFSPGTNAFMLKPAAAGGELISLTRMEAGDVDGLAVSPDGLFVVAAIKTHQADRYHLILMNLEALGHGQRCFAGNGDLGQACTQLTFGPVDDRRPFFVSRSRIAFYRSDPDGPMDAQGRMRARVLYSIASDGAELTRLAFGSGELLGVSQSHDGWLRALAWSPCDAGVCFRPRRLDPNGRRGNWPDGAWADASRLPFAFGLDTKGFRLAVCTARQGTFGAGSLCRQDDQGEFLNLYKAFSLGSSCSPRGRVKDAFYLGSGRFLSAFAKVIDGCVDASDDLAGRVPDFGMAVVDVKSNLVHPVYNDVASDELMVVPVIARELVDARIELPVHPAKGCQKHSIHVAGRLDAKVLAEGASRVRVLQRLSGADAPWDIELGAWDEVGALCSDAAGRTCAPVWSDGSFSVTLPADVPLRLQVIDHYGAAISSDARWRGGQPCTQLKCSGCHQSDENAGQAHPGLAESQPAFPLDDRPSQRSIDFSRHIQPILNRACSASGCHDSATAAGVYVDLTGRLRGLALGKEASGRWSAAYENLTFIDTLRDTTGAMMQQRHAYVVPGRARESRLIQKLGVPCRYDCAEQPGWAAWGLSTRRHPEDRGGKLSDEERWLLVEWIDSGAAFHGKGARP